MSSEWTLHTQLAAAQSGNANVAVRIANDTAAVAVAVAVSLGRATHPAGIGGREAHLVRGSTFIIYHQSVRNFLLVVLLRPTGTCHGQQQLTASISLSVSTGDEGGHHRRRE